MTTSPRKVRFTVPARRDLREILQTTATIWGSQRRDAYAAMLNEAVLRLAEFPLLGRWRDDVRSDVRGYPVEQHVILYRIDGEELVVLRVVHARRDVSRLSIP